MQSENQPLPPTQSGLQQSGQLALELKKAEADRRPDVTPLRKSNVRQDSIQQDKVGEQTAELLVADVFPASDILKEGLEHFLSSEDEDVCPTCLEDYTDENPRIVAQCNHHYHLSCIYEWMERILACPVCGEVNAFRDVRQCYSISLSFKHIMFSVDPSSSVKFYSALFHVIDVYDPLWNQQCAPPVLNRYRV